MARGLRAQARRAFPGSTVIGGLTGGMLGPGTARLVTGGEVTAPRAARSRATSSSIVLAQGCRPVGDPLFVTVRNLISGSTVAGGRSSAMFSTLDAAGRRAPATRCIGLCPAAPDVGAGDLIRTSSASTGQRRVVGQRPHRAGLNRAVPPARRRIHLGSSRRLASLAGHAPRRRPAVRVRIRRNLFGVSGHDSGTLRRMIDIPVAGMFSAGEIAPIQGATFVHGYSSVFGLIRPRAGR
jgi:hypothetical protein